MLAATQRIQEIARDECAAMTDVPQHKARRRRCHVSSVRRASLAGTLVLLVLTGRAVAGDAPRVDGDGDLPAPPIEAEVASPLSASYETPAKTNSVDELVALLHTPELAFEPEKADESAEGMKRWIRELRSGLPQVRFSVSKFHVDEAPAGALHAHFEVDREGLDDDGNRHVMRREQSWRIRQPAEGPLLVLAIEETPALVFPGSGPQIVCY